MVMLLSVSIVNVFIGVFLCAMIIAVTTLITPVWNTIKAILLVSSTNLRGSSVVRLMIADEGR